jgi:ribonuclease E
LVALRQIQQRIAQADVALMKVTVPHDVAMYLMNQKRDALAQLEARFATRIEVVVSTRLMPHQSEIEVRTRDVIVPLPVVRPGEVADADSTATSYQRRGPTARRATATTARSGAVRGRRSTTARPEEGSTESAESSEDRARRRGRRGGRGRRRGEGEELAAGADGAVEADEGRDVRPADDATDTPAGEVATMAASASPALVGDHEPAAGPVGPVPDVPVPAREPADDDPRLALYLLSDVPRGMRALAEDPIVGLAESENGDAASAAPARRRRRRGGRRTGRSRRPDETAEGEPSAEGDAPSATTAEAGEDAGSDGAPRSEAPRRRRRGGSGRRRRPSAGSETGTDGAVTQEQQAVARPAEPPVDS